MIPIKMRRKYEAYIASSAWKAVREKAVNDMYCIDTKEDQDRGNYHCERCGWNFHRHELEVHHLNYSTLERENRSDIAVLCSRCHAILDIVRANDGERRSAEALDDARFHGYMERVHGEEWFHDIDPSEGYEEYSEWAEKKHEEELY